MKEISRGKPGYEFGNLALDDDPGQSGLRRATVVALEDSNFIVLDKESYQRIIGSDRKKLRNKLSKILTESYFFHDFPKQILNAFFVFAEFEKFRMGQTILDWDKQTDKMYIIYEGTVILVKKKPEDMFQKGIQQFLDGVDTSKEVVKGDPMLTRSYKQQIIPDEICIRGVGMSFGEEFAVLGSKSDYRAVANTEEVTVVSVTREVIQKKLFQFMPVCKQYFEESIRERKKLGYPWKKDISHFLGKGSTQVDLFKEELKRRKSGHLDFSKLKDSNLKGIGLDSSALPFDYERDIGILCK